MYHTVDLTFVVVMMSVDVTKMRQMFPRANYLVGVLLFRLPVLAALLETLL